MKVPQLVTTLNIYMLVLWYLWKRWLAGGDALYYFIANLTNSWTGVRHFWSSYLSSKYMYIYTLRTLQRVAALFLLERDAR